MHCWKTINLEKQFGHSRVIFLSGLVMMTVFTLIYVPVNLILSEDLYDTHFYLFMAGMILIYPAHKLLHIVPILSYLNKIKYQVKRQLFFFPIFTFRVSEPIPKYRFILALLFPFFLINTVLLAGCVMMPHYSHYFTILTAFHTGICTIDLLYAKCLLYSPRDAMIEENEDGYEILNLQRGTI
ncbi:DUF3267 domain-containing protein [Bacillus salacetis]|uniref:DUF3267 domain-containing protein n=1 Tax=Bacillus salacetis TaxID=2315464 RepID=A0A3A1R100_9BACI|nr:DUF3267 domain-containing protein [Bacillus salacetis]RIW35364.1 DUF3267 domain-containing protein [Bacillus salacetis]